MARREARTALPILHRLAHRIAAGKTQAHRVIDDAAECGDDLADPHWRAPLAPQPVAEVLDTGSRQLDQPDHTDKRLDVQPNSLLVCGDGGRFETIILSLF